MARSRREKSASVSSNTAAPTVNKTSTSMGPPSPVSPTRASPTATRRKAPSVSKSVAQSPTAHQAKSAHAPARVSSTRFVVVAAVSFVAQSVARFIFNTGELGLAANQEPSWAQIMGQLTWKVMLQAICWYGGYDAVDVASLNAILESPKFILLHYFYNISITTLVMNSTISILTQALPFYLFRPLSAPHAAAESFRGAIKLRNRTIINDPITTLATSLTATITYTVILLLAASFNQARAFLVVHFAGLPDITFAQPQSVSTTYIALLIWLIPAGIASTQFLFRPAEGATSVSKTNAATGVNSIALAQSHFDPATASLYQHIYHNSWGWYTSRQKELIGRSTLLAAFLLAETVIHLTSEVRGVDIAGAFGFAGTWVAGTIVLGIVLDWVGGPSD